MNTSLKSALQLVWRTPLLALHLLLGVLLAALVFWALPVAGKRALTRWWSAVVVLIFHTRTRCVGSPPLPGQGVMVVSNHISWLDIPVLNSIAPMRFVAKAEIRRWPVIGFFCAQTGTIFIRRGLRHAVHQVMHHLKEVMQAGATVGVFPEGTTSAGNGLLPFHANLLQAVLEVGVPIVPVAVRYRDALDGTPSSLPAYIDQVSIIESLRRVLSSNGLIAEVTYLDPILATPEMTRHDLARQAQAAIAQSLGFALPHK